MAITSALSTVMTRRIAHQLDELSTKYVEAYGHLARMNVRSLEQALALRRMVIAKMQSPPDDAGFAERQKVYEAKGLEIDQEAQAARALINAIIDDTLHRFRQCPARPDRRSDRDTSTATSAAISSEENKRLLPLLEAGNFAEARASLARADTLRDEFNQKVEEIRTDMLAQVRADAVVTMRDQQNGHRHLGHPDRACGHPRTDVLALRQHRHHAAGPAAAGRHPRRRSRPARRIDRRHHARRDRPADGGVQQHGRAIAPQGADARNLRPICRSARRRRADRPAVAGRERRPAPGDDGAVLRHEGIYQPQRGHDAARPRQGDEPLSVDDVGADPQPSRHHRQIYRRRDHGLLGPSVYRGWRTGAAGLPCRRSRWPSAARRCGPNCPNCSACAPCRAIATFASASRPARCWSAASARNS